MRTTKRIGIAAALAAALALAGCATSPPEAVPSAAPPSSPGTAEPVVEALYAQHDAWAGTPYRLGGTSRAGIDCSAFVQTTYASRFERALPRTTRAQARVGRVVEREALEPGDLLFFRTGYKTRHVGIHVEAGRFLHASTSSGVTLSALDNPYWDGAFRMARRP